LFLTHGVGLLVLLAIQLEDICNFIFWFHAVPPM
jgi:hypothetical protein